MVSLPPSLPLFPLLSHVLLPSAYARIQVSHRARKSVALLESISEQDSKDVYIAVVPGTQLLDDAEDALAVEPAGHLQLDHLLPVGTAARVLQLSRLMQTGDWVVLLEGVCRVSVDGIAAAHGAQPFDMLHVTQLEMKANGAGPPPDAQVQELGRQLKATTKQLLKLLSRRTGVATTRRIFEQLDSVPPARAADFVAAALSSNVQERLAVLQAVDGKQRLKVALHIAQQALDSVQKAAASTPNPSSNGSSGSRSSNGSSSSSGSAATAVAVRGSNRSPQLTSGNGGGSTSRRKEQGQGGGGVGEAAALGDSDDEDDDLDALLLRLQKAAPPPDVLKAAAKELRRLRSMGEHQPGFAASRAYLEILSELPWQRTSHTLAEEQERGGSGASSAAAAGGQQRAQLVDKEEGRSAARSLREARAILDRAHYGLDKVKDRIVEYLAVMRLRGSAAKAPILCFIGAPGVGKTSLARSVAEVLGRPFVRIALGGVRDESEIRGHRRTYVGALPGRIIQGVRRAGVRDPVMLLDEVDKLSKDAVRGDPGSALLEVLDPEQNNAFVDAYISHPFDLSRVTFVATANRASEIPAPLLDRLEVITLGGYTIQDKAHIAERHLVPRLLQEHGLSSAHVLFPPPILVHIIERYTREAGVRSLSRSLAALCRHVAVEVVNANDKEALPATTVQQADSIDASDDAAAGAAAAASTTAAAGKGTLSSAPPAAFTAAATAAGQIVSSARRKNDKRHHVVTAETSALLMTTPGAGLEGCSVPWDGCSTAPLSSTPSDGHADAPTVYASGDVALLRHMRSLPDSASATSISGRSAAGAAAAGTPAALRPASQRNTWQTLWSRGKPAAPPAAGSFDGQQDDVAGTAKRHGRDDRQRGGTKQHGRQSGAAPTSAESSSSPGSDSQSRDVVGPTPSQSVQQLQLQQQQQQQSQQQQQQQQQVALGTHPPLASGTDFTPYPPDLLSSAHVPVVQVVVDRELVERVLGPCRFSLSEAAERITAPGAAAGLVWTAAGGMVQYIECVCIGKGSRDRPGQLTLTGQVGEVLEESARIALSWIRAHSAELGLDAMMRDGGDAPLGQALVLPGRGAGTSTSDQPALLRPWRNAGSNTSGRNSEGGSHNPPHEIDGTSSPADWAAPAPLSSAPAPALSLAQRSPMRCAVASRTAAATSDDLTDSGGSVRVMANPAFSWDIHVHLPAGAIAKDGPSAGITLAVALISLLTNRCVRADTAMTGELTLRGLVLPIGGVKEKLLAALQARLTRVVVPARNLRDVAFDVPPPLREGLEVLGADTLWDVLRMVFDPPLQLLPQPRL